MSRKLIGYIMFSTDSGAVHDDEVDLIRTEENASGLAREIIRVKKESDRYANPEHEDYMPNVKEFYDEQMEKAGQLMTARLSEDDDLIILAVYEDCEPFWFVRFFARAKRLLRRCLNV